MLKAQTRSAMPTYGYRRLGPAGRTADIAVHRHLLTRDSVAENPALLPPADLRSILPPAEVEVDSSAYQSAPKLAPPMIATTALTCAGPL